MGRFLYVILWTMLSATKGHYVSAIVGQNPSAQAVGISSSTVAKMTKGETISLSILEKICDELNCDFGDIISYDRKDRKQ